MGNYLQVLSNMNNTLGPYYRYESGTSLAGASVAGSLALMQEFFEQRLHKTNSPALMKALLINGARSLGNLYDFQVNSTQNFQGWGVPNLTNTLPPALVSGGQGPSSIHYFDQSAAEALTTGQSRTRLVKLTDAAQGQDLRITLVWTDPPGNPLASIKLVNDLDLVVTNLDNGDVFIGNDILSANDFNLPWATNAPPNYDPVNNVENVYLKSPGTNYSVTVVGRRVNVNALSSHPNDVVQDYALVISSGNGDVTDGLILTDRPIAVTGAGGPTVLTNSFVGDVEDVGGILLRQRVGANSPLIGTNSVVVTNTVITMGAVQGVAVLGETNQWHFYAFTNRHTVHQCGIPDLPASERRGATDRDIRGR
jgi:hypothetical protein